MVMNLYSALSIDIFKCALQASDLWVRSDISIYKPRWQPLSVHYESHAAHQWMKWGLTTTPGTILCEISVPCTTRNTIMLPHLIIHSSLHYLSTDRLREIKNKGKFQTFSYKSGRGRLREVLAYKRFQIQWFDLETFGSLENWSLRRGGRNRRFDSICIWRNHLLIVSTTTLFFVFSLCSLSGE